MTAVDTLIGAKPGDVRVTGKLGGPHASDGMTAMVELGDGAASTIINPWSFKDGGIEWHLRHGDAAGVRHAAASIVDSYDYLLSDNIPMKEAMSRLRLLRRARRELTIHQPS